MNIRKHIPNALTCGNLFCGCLAAVYTLYGNISATAILIAIAALFDFFDGMSARLLKVSSPIGKDLDSLADMISFGLVPGMIVFKMVEQLDWDTLKWSAGLITIATYFPFTISVFSGLRLAKFNNDSRQTDSFIGLNTPANTILITSIALIASNNDYGLAGIIKTPLFLFLLSIVSAYLLIAEIPLLALKFKSFGWKKNEYRYTLIVTSVGLFVLFSYVAVPLIIALYIVLSMIYNFNKPNSNNLHISH